MKLRPQLRRVGALPVALSLALVALGAPGCMVQQRARPGTALVYYADRVIYSERGKEPREMSHAQATAGRPAHTEGDGGGDRDYRPAEASAEKPRRAAKPVRVPKPAKVEKKEPARRTVVKAEKVERKRAGKD